MAEDLVEDVGLMQVIELVPTANEGGHRKLAVGQQGKEAVKDMSAGTVATDQPVAGCSTALIWASWGSDPGQIEPCQPGLVLVTGLALERRQLACDQDLPGAVLLVRVVDRARFIRLVGGRDLPWVTPSSGLRPAIRAVRRHCAMGSL